MLLHDYYQLTGASSEFLLRNQTRRADKLQLKYETGRIRICISKYIQLFSHRLNLQKLLKNNFARLIRFKLKNIFVSIFFFLLISED